MHKHTLPFMHFVCMHVHEVTGSFGRIVVHKYIEAHKKFSYVEIQDSRATDVQSLSLIHAHILITVKLCQFPAVCTY